MRRSAPQAWDIPNRQVRTQTAQNAYGLHHAHLFMWTLKTISHLKFYPKIFLGLIFFYIITCHFFPHEPVMIQLLIVTWCKIEASASESQQRIQHSRTGSAASALCSRSKSCINRMNRMTRVNISEIFSTSIFTSNHA